MAIGGRGAGGGAHTTHLLRRQIRQERRIYGSKVDFTQCSCVWKVSVVVGLSPLLFTKFVKKASRSLQLSMAFLMELIALTSLVGVRQFHGLVRHSPNTQNCQPLVKFSQRYCPHLQISKKSNTFAKSFLRCQSYESELSTMKSKRLEQILCLR